MPPIPIPKTSQLRLEAEIAAEVLSANLRLLNAIVDGDYETYVELCAPDLTCFEPESGEHLVGGLGFHKFYFDIKQRQQPQNITNTTMSNPQVRFLSADRSSAVVTYVRLTQSLKKGGAPITTVAQETRVWMKDSEGWKNVHFHRSGANSSPPSPKL